MHSILRISARSLRTVLWSSIFLEPTNKPLLWSSLVLMRVWLTHFVRSLILLNYSQPPFKKRVMPTYGPKVHAAPRRVFQTLLDFVRVRGPSVIFDTRTYARGPQIHACNLRSNARILRSKTLISTKSLCTKGNLDIVPGIPQKSEENATFLPKKWRLVRLPRSVFYGWKLDFLILTCYGCGHFSHFS